jgi:gamma-glutamyl-gamma-aminobutyrate hydrolase PuuD
MQYFFLFFILVFLGDLNLSSVLAQCERVNRTLKIGHTAELDIFYTFRMEKTAQKNGVKLHWMKVSPSQLKSFLTQIDALLVPGGVDISPQLSLKNSVGVVYEGQSFERFYQPSSSGKARDEIEQTLLQNYFQSSSYRDLPVLGICRGMQMMSVLNGLPLIQDLEAQKNISNKRYTFDTIQIIHPTSLIANLYKEKTLSGFKLHHQNPDFDFYKKYQAHFHDKLLVTATSEGNVVEVIEFPQRPRAMGVQFHPEKSWNSTAEPLFEWFIQNTCQFVLEKSGVSI